jgi:DNA repair protein RAD7
MVRQRDEDEEEDEAQMEKDDDGAERGKEIELIQAPQIEGFRLKQSPRFDIECVKALVSSCTNLTSLRLIDIGLLDDKTLDVIAQAGLTKLRDLSIANAGIHNGATGEALTDAGVIGSAFF